MGDVAAPTMLFAVSGPPWSELRRLQLLAVGLAVALVAAIVPASVTPDELLPPLRSIDDVANSSPSSVGASSVPDGLTAVEWASIRSQITATNYSADDHGGGPFTPRWMAETTVAGIDRSYVVDHPAQGFTAYFGERRVHIVDTDANNAGAGNAHAENEPVASFELVGFGHQGAVAPAGPAVVEATGNTVSYHREGLQEWYRNGANGVEQGFLIDAPPAPGASPVLIFDVAVETDGALIQRGDDVVISQRGAHTDGETFSDGGANDLLISGLKAFDATGLVLPTAMLARTGGVELHVEIEGAAYPITVDPLIGTVGPPLLPTPDTISDQFGFSVAIDGNRAVVGASGDDNGLNKGVGGVHVFVESAGSWDLEQTLLDPVATFGRGFSVDIEGDTIVVGAPRSQSGAGRVYVFVDGPNPADWTRGPGGTLSPASDVADNQFGYDVALDLTADPHLLLVGMPFDDAGVTDGGAVEVFARPASGGDFTRQPLPLTAASQVANDRFGFSVSADGGDAVIGAPSTGTSPGSAHVYEWNNGTGQYEPAATDPILNPGAPGFGWSVAVEGGRIAVGAPDHNAPTTPVAGSVYAYDGGVPVVRQAMTPTPGDRFGSSVDLSAPMLVVGAPETELGSPGAAYAFEFDGGSWTPQGSLARPSTVDVAQFGHSVAVSPIAAVVGAPASDTDDPDGGLASTFTFGGGAYAFDEDLTNPEDAAGDRFGRSLALDGETLVVGAFETDTAAGIGTGRIYVHRWVADGWDLVQTIDAPFEPASGFFDRFGLSAALAGNRLVVGAPYRDAGAADSGAVVVYDRPDASSDFGPPVIITPPAPTGAGFYGWAVGVRDDGTVYVGQPGDAATDAGTVYVVTDVGSTPTQTPVPAPNPTNGAAFGTAIAVGSTQWAALAPGAAAGGELSVFTGTNPDETFVYSSSPAPFDDRLAMNDRWIAVGAPNDGFGAVATYANDGTTWGFDDLISNPGGAPGGFGTDVAITASAEGDLLAAVAPLNDSDGTRWILNLSDGTSRLSMADTRGANAVAIDAQRLVTGSFNSDPTGLGTNAGEVRSYPFVAAGDELLTGSASGPDDDFGFSVEVADGGERAIVGAPGENGDTGAAYVFDRQGDGSWSESIRLTASDGVAGDRFGTAVSIDGDRAVVGATGAAGFGSVYVYERQSATDWDEEELTIAGASAGDEIGFAVDIDGQLIVVGAPGGDSALAAGSGVAYLFQGFAGGWSAGDPFPDDNTPLSDGLGPEAGDRFGSAVTVEGTIILVGSPAAEPDGPNGDDHGMAYLFRYGGGGLNVQRGFGGDPTGGNFGASVDLSGGTAVFGAPADGSGAVYIHQLAWGANGSVCCATTLEQKITSPTSGGTDRFGAAVAVSGRQLLVGVPGTTRGSVVAYDRGAGTWTEQGTTEPASPPDGAAFGTAVALADGRAIGGAPASPLSGPAGSARAFDLPAAAALDDVLVVDQAAAPDARARQSLGFSVVRDGDRLLTSTATGQAFIFERNADDTWSVAAELTGTENRLSDGFGRPRIEWTPDAIALAGDTAIVGAYLDAENGLRAGAVHVFRRLPGGTWEPVQVLREAPAGSRFGTSLAYDGARLAVGATDDSVGATQAGAVYVYTQDQGTGQFLLDATARQVRASDPFSGARFGYDVDIDGDRLAVATDALTQGEAGGVYVFDHDPATGDWDEVATSLQSSTASAATGFPNAIALTGDSLWVTDVGEDTAEPGGGAAFVFTRAGNGTWEETQVFRETNGNPNSNFGFGFSIDADDDRAIVGSVGGRAFGYQLIGSSWQETDEFTGSSAFGRGVAVSGTEAAIGNHLADIGATDTGAVQLESLTSAPTAPADALISANPTIGGEFATSVDVEGAWAVIGAPGDDSAAGAGTGAVHVALFLDGQWTITQTLEPADLQAGDEFGFDVAIGDNLIIVGAPNADDGGRSDVGKVYVYTRSGRNWIETPTLAAPIGPDHEGDRFGASVDTGSLRIIVGQPGSELPGDPADDIGRAYLYRYDGVTAPDLVTTVDPAEDRRGLGTSVDLEVFWAAVGAPDGTGTALPRAYVYQFDGAGWNEDVRYDGPADSGFGQAVALTGAQSGLFVGRADNGPVEYYQHQSTGWPSDANQSIQPPEVAGSPNEAFGSILDAHQELLVVADPLADRGGTDTGVAYGYQFSGTMWVSLETFAESGGASQTSGFARSAAIGNTQILVGAPTRPFAGGTGVAYPFEVERSEVAPANKVLSPTDGDDELFGINVDIDGDWAVVAAPGRGATSDGPPDHGRAYVFESVEGQWEFRQELVNPNPIDWDAYGYAVAIDGDIIAVGDVPESVHLWTRTGPGAEWTHDEELAPAVLQGQSFATSLALDDGVLAVGDFTGGDGGQVYAWELAPSGWTELANSPVATAGIDAGDRFGQALDVSAGTVVIGAMENEAPGQAAAGTAHVYMVSGGAITFDQTLLNPDGPSSSFFGSGVSIDGNRLVVSAFGSGGAVHVFEPDAADDWMPVARLDREGNNELGADFGREVALSGDTIVANAPFAPTTTGGPAAVSGGVVVIWQRTAQGWFRTQEVVAEDGMRNDRFGGFSGLGLALDGTSLLVGAYLDDNPNGTDAGSVYSFEIGPANKIIAGDGETDAFLGSSIDIDGDWAVVGAVGDGPGLTGAAYVLRRVGNGWVESEKLTPQDPLPSSSEIYGQEVAISGDLIAVAANVAGGEGYVEVFRRSGDSYSYVSTVTPMVRATNDRFAAAIDLDGNRLVVGSFNGPDPAVDGAAYVFSTADNGSSWSEERLLPPAGVSDFGSAIAIEGDVLFVGEPLSDLAAVDGGAVHVYRFDGASWRFDETIVSTRPEEDAAFGQALAVDNGLLVVGSPGVLPSRIVDGRAELFAFDSQDVDFLQLLPPSQIDRSFGISVSADRGRVVIGSRDDIGGIAEAGAAHVYEWNGSAFALVQTIEPQEPQLRGVFGQAVAAADTQLLVGAPADDNSAGVDAGAVYFYTLPPPPPPPTPDTPEFGEFTVAATDGGTTNAVGSISFAQLSTVASTVRSTDGGGVVAATIGVVASPDGDPVDLLTKQTTLDELDLSSLTIPLSEIPLLTTDGETWEDVLVGTDFEGYPLQSVTLADVYAAGVPVDQLDLGELNLAASPLNTIPLVTIALAGVPLNTIGGFTTAEWCSFLIGTALDCEDTNFDDRLDDGTATLLDLTLAGVPLNTIPLNTIPLNTIPLNTIPLNTIPLNTIVLDELPLNTIPLNTIPLNTIDLAGSPLNTIPLNTIPLNTIPLNTIPLNTIPLNTIPLNTIPLNTITIDGTPLNTIPLNTIDLGATGLAFVPLNTIPLNTIPLNTIPLNTIPLNTIPLNTIPLNTIPVDTIEGSPLNTIPLNTIPLNTIPLNTIPLNTIDLSGSPLNTIGDLVDCGAINCLSKTTTLGDAFRQGAIRPGVTLEQLPASLLAGITFHDLIDAGLIDEATLQVWVDTQNLSIATDLSGLTLGDLPSSALVGVTLGQLGQALEAITWEELAIALGFSESERVTLGTDFRTQLGADTLDEGDFGRLTLGDVFDLLPETTTLEDLGSALDGIRLGDLVGAVDNPTFSSQVDSALANLNMGQATAGAADPGTYWQDVTLGEIAQGLRGPGNPDTDLLGDLLTSLGGDVLALLTLGDLLASIVGLTDYPWETIDADTLATAGAGSPVNYRTTFRVDGTIRTRPVVISIEVPLGARYEPGSGQLSTPAGSEPIQPAASGSNLSFVVPASTPGVTYTLDFGITPALSIGTADTIVSATIDGTIVEATGTASLTVSEPADPGDTIDTALEITEDDFDSLLLQRISTGSDIDLYQVNVDQGDRLSVILSNLPGDFDLVLYGPQPTSILPPGRDDRDLVDDQGLNPGDSSANLDTELADDIPSSLEGRPVVARSTRRGNQIERFDTGPLSSGDHYLQVSGYNGAASSLPYALRLNKAEAPPSPPCSAPDFDDSGEIGTIPTDLPADLNTIFVLNQQRMGQLHGNDEAASVITAIDDLLTSPAAASLGLVGAVIPVDGDTEVAAKYSAWSADNTYCDPVIANEVVAEIDRLIRGIREQRPGLRHIVIVGADDVVPFARVADLTTLANEADYRTGFAAQNTPLLGALSGGYILTDDVYGDDDPRGFDESRTFYLADLAIGRLVETPDQIVAQLGHFVASDGELEPTTAYVAAYDFLSDGGQDIAATLDAFAANGNHPLQTVDADDIDDSWERSDLDDGLDAAAAAGQFLGSVNAHFDHYRALPAAGDSTGNQSDLFTIGDLQEGASADLDGSLLFSMGCHSGLSVSDLQYGGDDFQLDWAQAITASGGVWIGNTGYAYGDTEANLYTERLMTLFTERLDGSVDVGQALLFAKQQYSADLGQTGVYDAKVLMESTFYGLPFFEIDLPQPITPPDPPEPPAIDPDPVTGQDTDTIDVTPTIEDRPGAEPGETYWVVVDDGADSVEGLHYRPLQPRHTEDITVTSGNNQPLDLVAHGALVTDLTTTDFTDVDPVVVRPTFDNAVNEPEPQFGEVTFPAEPLEINTYLTPQGERQQLVMITGQFRSEESSSSGTQRIYDDADVVVYYAEPNETDFNPPVFERVSATVVANLILLDVEVADAEGPVERVFGLLADDPPGCAIGGSCVQTNWVGVELSDNDGDGVWVGSVPITSTGERVEYLIQAVDAAGNVGVTANKARNYEAETPPVQEAVSFDLAPSGTKVGDWYTGDVLVEVVDSSIPNATFSYEILGSGAGVLPYPASGITVSGEGAKTVVVTGEGPGSQPEVETILIRIDDAVPAILIGPPSEGAVYTTDEPRLLDFDCVDATSGIASCEATIDGQATSNGADLTASLGAHTLLVSAQDRVGNTASKTVRWQVVPPCAAEDELIVNGGFEINDISRGSATVTDLDGWDIDGTGVRLTERPNGGARGSRTRAVLDVGDNSAISQTLATVPGETYRVQFWYRKGPATLANTNGVELWWDGGLVDTVDAGLFMARRWTGHQYTFIADSASTTLELRGAGWADGRGGEIDLVSVRCDPLAVANPSFEEHAVLPGQSDVVTELPGWTVKGTGVRLINEDRATDGSTHVELDGAGNSTIVQEIPAQKGTAYLLTVDLPPSPGTGALSSLVEVRWNGRRVAQVTASRFYDRLISVTVRGRSTPSVLELRGRGRSDGKGAPVDNVQIGELG